MTYVRISCFRFTLGIGVLGLNAASKAKVVLCSDSNEYVDEVFDKCADSLPEVHLVLFLMVFLSLRPQSYRQCSMKFTHSCH
jgi:hypothetical protein